MLRADIILERVNTRGKLLQRRRQRSRSWTRNFLGMLYVAHAHLARGEPYTQPDIYGNSRQMDVEERGVPLIVASPGGITVVTSLTDYDEDANISGDLVGIQLGQGTTAPTPTDYALENRIGHSDHVPETVNRRGEYYLTQVTPGERELYGSSWYALEFQPVWSHELWTVRLKFYREGSPGTVTISIRSSLTGADLAAETLDGNLLTTDPAGEWKDINFATKVGLTAFTPYYVVMRATAGDSTNSVHVICDEDEVYEGGRNHYSSNSGGSWSSHSGYGYSYCCLFEEFGRNVDKGIIYGGCEIYGLSFAHPNGEFRIRRNFHNVSGDSWSINEVGIHALGTHSPEQGWAYLIARDIVSPPIVVASGEVLRVAYVPQITV